MSRRAYIIGVILLLVLLAATTALGAGLGTLVSRLSDSEPVRLLGVVAGALCGFLFGAGMCAEAISFSKAAIKRHSETGKWTAE
jgi:uncharacterized membrane protein required for colicin V production